jgi:hypothetical protein
MLIHIFRSVKIKKNKMIPKMELFYKMYTKLIFKRIKIAFPVKAQSQTHF